MNANEVIANRANQLLGGDIGSKKVHPNDHIYIGQSSNDVTPTAMQVAACVALQDDLLPGFAVLRTSLAEKAEEYDHIVKSGRTHLMDATPIRLGQVFGGFAAQIALGMRRVKEGLNDLAELPLGRAAVGTGINTHPEFAEGAVERRSTMTRIPFRVADKH